MGEVEWVCKKVMVGDHVMEKPKFPMMVDTMKTECYNQLMLILLYTFIVLRRYECNDKQTNL